MPESQYRARQVSAKTQEVVSTITMILCRANPCTFSSPVDWWRWLPWQSSSLSHIMTWFEGELDQITGLRSDRVAGSILYRRGVPVQLWI